MSATDKLNRRHPIIESVMADIEGLDFADDDKRQDAEDSIICIVQMLIDRVATAADTITSLKEENERLKGVVSLCEQQLLALYNSISPHAEYVSAGGKPGNRFADQDAAYIAARALAPRPSLTEGEGK